ncbi:RHS repeat-associated core domain-containing protein [Sorangium sp. So ce381]|uniref:RHS repeat-associated core domain-containing protein n=1 Tax=Sorangium sp. So ce381 TaxID=3133307 RepID=UPI003F5C6B2D
MGLYVRRRRPNRRRAGHPGLGSTQYVSDQDQALSQHVEYLPSGELWADQTDSRVQNRQPYLFNGKELDLSTGLYHYGARSYEPRLGVWVSPDPVLTEYMAGKLNEGVYRPINLSLYTYAWNNPVVLIDPDGRLTTQAIAEAFVKGSVVVGTALSVPATAAVVEPTPIGELVVGGLFAVGTVGYAIYTIATADSDESAIGPSCDVPADFPTSATPGAPPPLEAGGGGAKEPPKPPAATAAEPPEQPAGGGLFKGKVDPYSLTPTHGITLGRNRCNALKQDIAEHGMKDTIKFVEHNGQRYVVNGHHRLRIAKELKMPEVPVEQVKLPYQ